LEKNLAEVHEAHTNALQLVASKEAEKEALRADWNDEKARRDLAEQRLQNKIVESTKLQSENVELLLNKADNIRLNADLSGKLAETAKAKIALDNRVETLKIEYSNEITKLKETLETQKKALESEVSKRDSILAEKTKAIEKALLENKRVYKILNEAGLIVVDNAGNIVSH
jgi:hypothetical protein